MTAEEPSGRTPQQRRRRLLKLSAVLFVLLPTSLVIAYYGFVASNQYAAEVRFAVRSPEMSNANELLGVFAGAGVAGSTVTDSYILMDYLRSRQLLENLKEKLDLDAIFNSQKADPLYAFSVKDNPIEDFVDYWRSMVQLDFDTASRIIVLEVRTFDPKHTKMLAEEVLRLSEALVNRLSERARQDALRSARAEVARIEERLRKTLRRMRRFREVNQNVDPAQSVSAQVTRLSTIESQLNVEKAQLAAQMAFMNADAPAVQFTKAKIKALEAQAAEERLKFGKGQSDDTSGVSNLSRVVEDYQALATDLEFTQKAYLSAQTSLERARINADQQQRYLATFVPPSLPEKALYPQRVANSFVAAVLFLCAWAIGVLAVYSVRDHAL